METTLFEVQQELKAPKNKHNSFGNYNYRSCEDILEAVKPLLKKYHSGLLLGDTLQEIGGRVYVTATAIYIEPDGTRYSVTASAQDSGEKKGMDAAQVTGTASSYARKYALNGLFLIDDTKDPDSDEYIKTAVNGIKKVEDAIEFINKQKEAVAIASMMNLLKLTNPEMYKQAYQTATDKVRELQNQ